jgi:aminoglycoside phosphotransferase (APT) family kinase protein
MLELGIPDSLIHNDLNPGNILFDGSRYVFADWCEAYVGNPFLVFQQLCALVSRDQDESLPWVRQLRVLYKHKWSALLAEPQMEQAFTLTPLLAVLSCLYGRGTWLTSSLRDDSELQGYKRSLARYMDRAAQNPRLIEALWH